MLYVFAEKLSKFAIWKALYKKKKKKKLDGKFVYEQNSNNPCIETHGIIKLTFLEI